VTPAARGGGRDGAGRSGPGALVVVDDPRDWALDVPGVEVVDARRYLTDHSLAERRRAKVFNLCRSYRYQTLGYYVSLLAAARGHRPLPSINTLQDLKSVGLVRGMSSDLDEHLQQCLAPLQSDRFTLSIYFGRNMAARYERLARQLFNLFPSPLLRAQFARGDSWTLQSLRPIAAKDIPASHLDFVRDSAERYFAGHGARHRARSTARYDLAVLLRPDDPEPPSNARAIRKFTRAAESLGLRTTIIERQDQGRIAEFDALFIRETTAVAHHTYRIAARAESEGLVVIDDPRSIIRCANKVFLEELLDRHDIARPKTLIVHEDNTERVAEELGLPCVLKKPDSSFSEGVIKVDDPTELAAGCERMLETSDLFVAQEFVKTDFDWRVGVLDRQPLWVCRYAMALDHWQIINRDRTDEDRYGEFETMSVAAAPPQVVAAAVKAANAIGDGLYGVDLKQVGRRVIVMEVNDNPNLDAGVEDQVLGDEVYARIMRVFLARLERRGARWGRP
jgi:glutathione synthase/RimK-type ligase-like ATP-grasp enzyme